MIKNINMKIGTHNGLHHPDDVIACSILKKIYDNVDIIRSRNFQELDQCSILIDVGNKYQPPKYFDHHHKNGPRRDNGVPFSSCGLIWKHYGKEFISKILSGVQLSFQDIDEIFTIIDNTVILYVDKVDNQIITPEKTSICEYVMMLNDNGSIDSFYKALDVMSNYFEQLIKYEYNKISSKKYILKLSEKAINDGLNYIILEYELDISGLKEENNIDFVIYPSSDKKTIILKCLPYDNNPLIPRFIFEEKWRGLRGEQITQAGSEVDSVIFVHHQGFCGGAKTIEGAIAMINMTFRNFK